ncbi:MAG: hypothetical protein P8010_00925 [Desulfosarcinaceae bacterium]|jgi:predicted 3-demethylubiquinone-9 3-methyltransferase (glyoxalase superfamily)
MQKIIPTRPMELLTDPDPVKTNRAMQAMLAITKIDIAVLEAAYLGTGTI